jgi:hypothetical protein
LVGRSAVAIAATLASQNWRRVKTVFECALFLIFELRFITDFCPVSKRMAGNRRTSFACHELGGEARSLGGGPTESAAAAERLSPRAHLRSWYQERRNFGYEDVERFRSKIQGCVSLITRGASICAILQIEVLKWFLHQKSAFRQRSIANEMRV